MAQQPTQQRNQQPQKEKDIGQIVRYLTNTFNTATAHLERPWRVHDKDSCKGEPNTLYILQRDFAYLINDLTIGPRATVQRSIAECNNFIDQVMTTHPRPKTK